METLLHILGLRPLTVPEGSVVTRVSSTFAASPAWILAALVLLGVLVALTILLYRREHSPRRGKPINVWAMTSLRIASLTLLIAMLVRPTLTVTYRESSRRQLAVLLDTSASMAIRDVRLDPADVDRLKPFPTLGSAPSRAELAATALSKDLLAQLKKEFDLRLYTFDSRATPLSDTILPTTRPTADRTALGDVLRDVITATRGVPMAGILLATDGGNNAGLSPLSAAPLAKTANVALYTYGVGVSHPRDVAARNLVTPEIGFVDDEISATLQYRATGYPPGTKTKVKVRLGDTTLKDEELSVTADSIDLRFTPKTSGDLTLSVDIDPLEGESVKDNNHAEARLRIVDGRIKVLYAESSPRWEFKYLQADLLRDRRVSAKFWLQTAAPSTSADANSPYLRTFPATKNDLFKYDVLILGDVDLKDLPKAAPEWIDEYVNKLGGGLVLLAGRAANPVLYTGTSLEPLLPILPGKPASSSTLGTALRLELTPAGRLSAMLRLAPDEDANIATWSRLPPIYWSAPLSRAKPGAETLAVTSTAAGRSPLMVTQGYGLGSVVFIGTDNLWRIRRNVGDELHSRLWGQILQRLALPHLLGESKRTQLSSDKRTYATGDTASLFARLYTSTYEPLLDPEVKATLTLPSGDVVALTLRPIPDSPGAYRAETALTHPGVHRFAVASDPKTVLELEVSKSARELSEIAMNEPLLRDLAKETGGAFLHEEDLQNLPKLLSSKADASLNTATVPLSRSPLYFILIVACLTTEWILRKSSELK